MPDLADGEALVRVNLINIHSATRSRMANGMTKLGDTDKTNYAFCEVIASRDPAFHVGDRIACQAGWQDHQVVRSADPSIGYGPISDGAKALNHTNSQWTYVFRPQIVAEWPSDVIMEMFGTSGMTAYFGMRECGPLGAGTDVAVAGASGSVGAIAAQLARAAGSRVIGFAGGGDRCRWVVETLKIDDCLDYRAPDFAERLAAAFPNGIDVYSDGIGGPLTETVVKQMKRGGRLFAYGGAAAFYAEKVTSEQSMTSPQQKKMSLRQAFGITDAIEAMLQEKDIRAECWIVDQFYHERLKAEDDLADLMRRGVIKPVNHVVAGFDNLPTAIAGLYESPRAGKLQVLFSE